MAKSSFTVPTNVRLRLEQHLVVGVVGNRAAGGERGEARVAAAAERVVDGVVMMQRTVAAAAGAVALGQHAHHFIEFRCARDRGRDRRG